MIRKGRTANDVLLKEDRSRRGLFQMDRKKDRPTSEVCDRLKERKKTVFFSENSNLTGGKGRRGKKSKGEILTETISTTISYTRPWKMGNIATKKGRSNLQGWGGKSNITWSEKKTAFMKGGDATLASLLKEENFNNEGERPPAIAGPVPSSNDKFARKEEGTSPANKNHEDKGQSRHDGELPRKT